MLYIVAAPNQFSTPAMVSSSGAMQFISQQQPVNYPPTAAGATVPQQYVPAGYGFYAPQPQMHPGAAPVHPVAAPMPAGFSVYASSQQKQQFVNGASAANTGSGSSSAGTHVAPLAAAGSWPSQTQQQVVNPFLVSVLFDLLVFFHKIFMNFVCDSVSGNCNYVAYQESVVFFIFVTPLSVVIQVCYLLAEMYRRIWKKAFFCIR